MALNNTAEFINLFEPYTSLFDRSGLSPAYSVNPSAAPPKYRVSSTNSCLYRFGADRINLHQGCDNRSATLRLSRWLSSDLMPQTLLSIAIKTDEPIWDGIKIGNPIPLEVDVKKLVLAGTSVPALDTSIVRASRFVRNLSFVLEHAQNFGDKINPATRALANDVLLGPLRQMEAGLNRLAKLRT